MTRYTKWRLYLIKLRIYRWPTSHWPRHNNNMQCFHFSPMDGAHVCQSHLRTHTCKPQSHWQRQGWLIIASDLELWFAKCEIWDITTASADQCWTSTSNISTLLTQFEYDQQLYSFAITDRIRTRTVGSYLYKTTDRMNSLRSVSVAMNVLPLYIALTFSGIINVPIYVSVHAGCIKDYNLSPNILSQTNTRQTSFEACLIASANYVIVVHHNAWQWFKQT